MRYQRKSIPVRNIFIEDSFPRQRLRVRDRDYFRRSAFSGTVFEDLLVYPIAGNPGCYGLIHGYKRFTGLRYITEMEGSENLEVVCKVIPKAAEQPVAALLYLTMNRGLHIEPFVQLGMLNLALDSFSAEEISAYSNIHLRHIENLLMFQKLSAEVHHWVREELLPFEHVLYLLDLHESTEEVEHILKRARDLCDIAGESRITAATLEKAVDTVAA